MSIVPHQASPFAAVFIDFENLYYFLKNEYNDPAELNDYVLEIVRGIKSKLKEQEPALDCLIMHAYADFERLTAAPQGALYLMGVSTRNVLGTNHKNAADMQLCIDALEVMYTRPDIGTFVILAGDRDYIPVINHLHRSARRVEVVGFSGNTSGDLIQMLGMEHFTDAASLLSTDSRERLHQHRARHLEVLEARRRNRENGVGEPGMVFAPEADPNLNPITGEPHGLGDLGGVAHVSAPAAGPTRRQESPAQLGGATFARVCPILDETTKEVLRRLVAMSNYFANSARNGHSKDLWMTATLRKLEEHFPALADYERRGAINALRDQGALRVEKRAGEPNPYSVIILNPNHPDVRAANLQEEPSV